MRFFDVACQRMLNALDESAGDTVGATYMSLHSAYSSIGSNELVGGSPAYARRPIIWLPASGRSKLTQDTIIFDVPAASDVRWIGFFDAAVAGTCLGMMPNNGGVPEVFVVPDSSTDIVEAPQHGFFNGNAVVVWAVPGADLPTPLVEGTVYYVISVTADDLQLALAPAGSAINMTALGSGYLQKIVEEHFTDSGTHAVTSATMGLN